MLSGRPLLPCNEIWPRHGDLFAYRLVLNFCLTSQFSGLLIPQNELLLLEQKISQARSPAISIEEVKEMQITVPFQFIL